MKQLLATFCLLSLTAIAFSQTPDDFFDGLVDYLQQQPSFASAIVDMRNGSQEVENLGAAPAVIALMEDRDAPLRELYIEVIRADQERALAFYRSAAFNLAAVIESDEGELSRSIELLIRLNLRSGNVLEDNLVTPLQSDRELLEIMIALCSQATEILGNEDPIQMIEGLSDLNSIRWRLFEFYSGAGFPGVQ